MLRHDQIKQCVIEIRQAIETGNAQKQDLERQLTEVMVQLRDLQAGLRLAAELSQISWTEEQEREGQLKAIQEKANAVLNGVPGLSDPGVGDDKGEEGCPGVDGCCGLGHQFIPAEAACDGPCEAMAGHAN